MARNIVQTTTIAAILVVWQTAFFLPRNCMADGGTQEQVASLSGDVSTVSFEPTAPEEIFGTTVVNAVSHSQDLPFELESPPSTATSPPEKSESSVIIDGNTTITSDPEDCGTEICIDENEDGSCPLSFFDLHQAPYTSYRSKRTNYSWVPGSGQNFGLFEWQTDPYLERNESTGFTSAMNITWLSGPETVALPSRVYELSTGIQSREQWSPLFSYDVAARIGIFSDFEGSAREGVRFPGHAVGMLHINHLTDLVFGVDFLDRDDINLLPVLGLSLRSDLDPRLRLDLVFPRPQINLNITDSRRLYLAGMLGGDTWDVDDGVDLVATYRDYRLMLGVESANGNGETSTIEFGYVFGRHLELRGQPNQTEFDDAFIIRLVTRH